MPFKKGRAKTGGRAKGTPHKTTAQIRGVITNVCEEYFNSDKFQADLREMGAEARSKAMLKLLEFSAPRLQAQAIQLQSEDKDKPIEVKITRKIIGGRNEG